MEDIVNKQQRNTPVGRSKVRLNIWPIISVIALVLAVFFYWQIHQLKQNSQTFTQEQTNELVAKVSNLILLPTNEIPTVATVSDPNALKGQAFFANAQKGDKVLIYSQAKEAILYSVSLNKIINVAPLNTDAEQASISNPSANTQTPATKTTTTDSSSKNLKHVYTPNF